MSAAPYLHDALAQFRDAIADAGLTPPESIEADGKRHRFASNGKRGDLAGWYVLHADGIPAGAFGCWRSQVKQTWCANIGRTLSDAEREQYRQFMESVRRQCEQAEHERHAEAARQAAAEWDAAKPAPDSHEYLARKQVRAHGLRADADGRLLVPVRNRAGEWQSLQRIAPDGTKRFLWGGRMTGGYFAIGTPDGVLCVAEGFATAASIHEATGHPVAVAFNAGNLEAVARALREKLPKCRLILCADDDAATDGNPGLTKATEAARAVGGLVAVPNFGANRPEGATDLNDLALYRGADAVRACIAKAAKPDAELWPEPLPLIGEYVALPYPLDALPGAIGDAVREVVAFVQCPAALAACSALSVVSVAAQALADVRRGPGLVGPVSLYFLPIAESGERKTESDRQFGAPLREWEAEERERVRADVVRSRAELTAWEVERESLVQEIKKQARRGGEAIHELRAKLAELESVKPEPVRVPHLLMESETPENLAWTLARPDGWPSAGLLSSEAGVIFGGHAMNRDSIMRSLALFNKLWSGEPYRVGRKTSECFELDGVRLTLGLATQPETVRTFFEESRGLARATGFAARFLIAWPESTQGTREYRDPPEGWPGLAQFKARIRRLLDTHATVNLRGQLMPPPLDMEPEAFEGWKRFYNGTERELRSGGELADVRDVASKAADNVARLSALFHLFENGPGGRIGADHLARAARIVTWHLAESRRFLGGLAVPKPVANAVKLDAWLLDACRKGQTDSIPKRDVLRLGPNPVRLKAELMAALAELRDAERARLSEDGRTIRINPALLRG